MLCISYVSFSVMIDGKPGCFFKPSRGIRQGDPLSPYLFLLISEVLSRNIALAVNNKSLRGLKINKRGPCLSHLFFADDSLFFLRATKRNCQRLIEILECYSRASGQQINHQKSTLYFSSNTPLNLRKEIRNILHIAASEHPGKYLGLPSIWGRSKCDALSFVRDRIKQKIQGWKTKTFTMASREVLIKSVAMEIPTYPMSCFKFPSTTCNQINSDLSRFW